jgi:hypothetical protein
MQLDDDDRVLLDRDRVEPRVVEDPEVEMRGLGPVATERRGVQDRRLALGLGKGRAAARPVARARSSKNRSIRGIPVGTTSSSGMPKASA